jgi:Mg-chelatase subunit ChlD
MSVNYPSGMPHNFELVQANGRRNRFSTISGLTEELKLATVRQSDCLGGFRVGELYSASGRPGVIVKISPDGRTIRNPWVTLPGEDGLLRGSLFQDRYCAMGGDLVVVTTTGGVWRVTSAGVALQLADLGTHLEGVTTVPDEPDRYGPWAGRILAGAEDQGLLYAVDAAGGVESWDLDIEVEDIDVVLPGANFFGVDYSGTRLVGAGAEQWMDKVCDVIIAQELPGVLFDVRWNRGTGRFEVTRLADVAQFEHVTFSSAGIREIPPATPIVPPPPCAPLPPPPTDTPTATPPPSATPSPTTTPSPTLTPSPTTTASPTATRTPTPRPIYLPVTLGERCPEQRQPADVVLVVDASTSMQRMDAGGRTKLDAARAAVRDFLALLSPDLDQAALVWFNDRAVLARALTYDLASVASALDRIEVHPGTRLDLGLRSAAEELGGPRRTADAQAALVLLTDGLPNTVPTPEGGGRPEDTVLAEAASAKAAGAELFVIGLGQDVDLGLLAQIASRPDALYRAGDADELSAVYRTIARRIPCSGPEFWP